MQATLSCKFQITIPARLRRKFHLKPGMKLVFDETAADLRARPKYDFDVEAMRGALGAAKDHEPGKTSDQILREMRGYDRRTL
ncbi:MAG: AbrB/MazE/SpoVT family DNA-binding domain-containing protein [Opitutus sp.]|nr:AbrB/MazE/SpoVT family DNA-binding domain-containing protein [Opitutus sp.]